MSKKIKILSLLCSLFALFLLFVAGGGCSAPSPEPTQKTTSIEQIDVAKTTAVKAKFSQTEGLAESDLKVKVINTECTIEGTVPSQETKDLAERTALSVEGVKTVNNKLKVKK